jgi:hypothetical protein
VSVLPYKQAAVSVLPYKQAAVSVHTLLAFMYPRSFHCGSFHVSLSFSESLAQMLGSFMNGELETIL